MATRLTDATVRDLPLPATGNRITYDSEVHGFGARVTAKGARSFVLTYRNRDARQRRFTIGAFPDWKVTAARAEAKRLKIEVDRGGDPMGDIADRRAAPTVRDLCTAYRAEHLPGKRANTARNDELMIRREILPRFGARKVADIRHAEIAAMHREIVKDRPYTANRTLALCKRLFNFAAHPDRRWRDRADNPAKGVAMIYESRRERYLTTDELKRLVAVLAEWPCQQTANAVRVLLLTGARKDEVLSAAWAQFDLAAGTWRKPAATTKSKKDHVVMLAAPVLKLLADIRAEQGPAPSAFVFPGRGRKGYRDDLKSQWAKILAVAQIEDLRIHDLRHSHASLLVNAGFSLEVIRAVLGHASTSTTLRYSHLYDETKQAAADRVAALVSPQQPGADVVPLKGHRR
jgi:integrase